MYSETWEKTTQLLSHDCLDFKKYFLDIEKLQKYPLTFVIKSEDSIEVLLKRIEEDALKFYSAKAVVDKYMSYMEELINIPVLKERFGQAIKAGYLDSILTEVINQSKVEFNFNDIEAD